MDKKLHSLIIDSKLDSNPITPEKINKFDKSQWIPILSLLKFLKVTPQSPLVNTPYLSSNQFFINKWNKILSNEKKPIIGINWQGNLNSELSLLKGRSIPLESFSPIFKTYKAKALSLQKGSGSEQLKKCSFKNKFVRSQSEINKILDFSEVAAIIMNCDLIITSDTVIAHLAGGLGKPTWLLLKYIPEWRWGLKGEKTFWYNSIKIFRQSKKEEWEEVIKSVSDELDNFFTN